MPLSSVTRATRFTACSRVASLIDVKAHTDFLSVAANTYLAATDLMRRLSHDAVEECKPFLL
jgi:hypothetical protein